MTSKMQVIHALVQVAFRWREWGSTKREGRRFRKIDSSTRLPRGDQVDGLPRVVSRAGPAQREMPRRAKLSEEEYWISGVCPLIPYQHELQNFVVILKIRKLICISFSIREQNLNLQVRQTVWYVSRLRLCVLDCCPGGFKHAKYMSKLSNICKIFEMHEKHL